LRARRAPLASRGFAPEGIREMRGCGAGSAAIRNFIRRRCCRPAQDFVGLPAAIKRFSHPGFSPGRVRRAPGSLPRVTTRVPGLQPALDAGRLEIDPSAERDKGIFARGNWSGISFPLTHLSPQAGRGRERHARAGEGQKLAPSQAAAPHPDPLPVRTGRGASCEPGRLTHPSSRCRAGSTPVSTGTMVSLLVP